MHDVWRWSEPSGRMLYVPAAALVWPRPLTRYCVLPPGWSAWLEGWWVNHAADLVTIGIRPTAPERCPAAAKTAGGHTAAL